MVKDKKVNDSISIMLRKTQGRWFGGQTLTAGTVKNKESVQQLIQRDDAYRFLKNVPRIASLLPDSQCMYDVLAIISWGCQHGSSRSQLPTCSGPTSYRPLLDSTEPPSLMKTLRPCLSKKIASGCGKTPSQQRGTSSAG